MAKASDVKLFIEKSDLSPKKQEILLSRLNGVCPDIANGNLTDKQLDLVFEGMTHLRTFFVPQ